jgi:hypothetical protein
MAEETVAHPFSGRRTRVLGMEDVRKLLDVDTALDIQRNAFIALARGQTVAAPNAWLRLPGERRGWLKLLAGYDASRGGLGVKVLARFPGPSCCCSMRTTAFPSRSWTGLTSPRCALAPARVWLQTRLRAQEQLGLG